MLAHLISDKKECITINVILNEENFITLYTIGDGTIHLTGYTLKVETLPNEEEDIFKALKPKK